MQPTARGVTVIETNRLKWIILFNAFLMNSTNPLVIFMLEEACMMLQALAEIALETECWPECA